MGKKLNCFLFLILSGLISKGQGHLLPEDFKRSYFVDGGAGYGTSKSLFWNIHLNAELNKRRALTFGVFNSSNSRIKSDFTKIESYFIGVGKIIKDEDALLILSAGPSYSSIAHYNYQPNSNPVNSGLVHGTTELTKTKRVIGLQLKAHVMWAWKVSGAGFTAFVDLNSESPYAGVGYNIALGRVHFLR